MKNYVIRDLSEHAKCGTHPNVIQYLKCFHTDKHLGVVTQFAAGGDLMSVISARCAVFKPSEAPCPWPLMQPGLLPTLTRL